MSAKAEKKAEAAPQEGAPKKKKGLLLIIVGVVVLLAAGGGGAAFMMMNKHDKKAQQAKAEKHGKKDGDHAEADEEEAAAENDHGKDKKKAPVFYTMEPFVVNLAGDSQHYLQVGVDLKLSKDEFVEKIKTVTPEIRNEVVLLLSNKQTEDLATMDGKNYLRAQIRKAANKAVGVKDTVKRKPADEHPDAGKHDEDEDPYPAPKRGVVDVLLTSFVIQ